ncbi:LOW QUALITY PROTEIN: tektin-5 [Chlamydotis macqueenii]
MPIDKNIMGTAVFAKNVIMFAVSLIIRDAQHAPVQFFSDKKISPFYDEKCFNLRNTADSINFYHGVEKADRTDVPATCKFSEASIRCFHARANSVKLEDAGVGLESTSEMWNHFISTSLAFNNHIAEGPDAKNKLQAQLAKQMSPKYLEYETILEGTYMIAFKFLSGKRKLVTDIYTIDDTLQTLKRHLQEARDTLHILIPKKSKLEYGISVKKNSFLDKKRMCKVFPSTPWLIGYT